MNFLTITSLFFQNNLEQLQATVDANNLGQLISILSIGFITLLALLILSLITGHKQKKRIKILENQLNSK